MTTSDLNEINKLLIELEERLDKKIDRKLDERFVGFEKKMDERFVGFEKKMDRKLEDKFTENNKILLKQIQSLIDDSEVNIIDSAGKSDKRVFDNLNERLLKLEKANFS